MKIITGLIVGFIYLWQLALLIIGCIPILIVAGIIVQRVSKCYSRLCVETVLHIYMCINYCSLLYVRTCKHLYLSNSDDWFLHSVICHVCVQICVRVCVYMCVYVCMYMYVHMWVYISVCACVCTCVHVCECVYMRVYV